MSLQIVILASGNGSNAQAIIDAIESGKLDATVKAIICDKNDAFVLERAHEHGIQAYLLTPLPFEARECYDERLRQLLAQLNPDLIVLAGFMRILSAHFVNYFAGQIINIHPSLLPKYKGLHTHQRALENGDAEHGCSIHFVTEALDGGPIIAQSRLNIKKSDTPKTLHKRVQVLEHKLYPTVVSWFARHQIRLDNGRVVLDEMMLPEGGLGVC